MPEALWRLRFQFLVVPIIAKLPVSKSPQYTTLLEFDVRASVLPARRLGEFACFGCGVLRNERTEATAGDGQRAVGQKAGDAGGTSDYSAVSPPRHSGEGRNPVRGLRPPPGFRTRGTIRAEGGSITQSRPREFAGRKTSAQEVGPMRGKHT